MNNRDDFRDQQKKSMKHEEATQLLRRFMVSDTPDYSFLMPSDGRRVDDRIISYGTHAENYLHNLKIALITTTIGE